MRIRLFAAMASLLLAATASHAQLFRAYLASYGSDTNPCTVGAPCRLLPAALAAVASGGEIWILDSANFNAATVDVGKSVTITGVPGALASLVAVAASPAVTISTADVRVSFRNINFARNAVNPGTHGIVVTNAAFVGVSRCTFVGGLNRGVLSTNNTGLVEVADSQFIDLGSFAADVENGPTLNFVRSNVLSGAGLMVSTTADATTTVANVADSSISGATRAVWAFSQGTGAVSKAYVTRSVFRGHFNGLNANGTAQSNSASIWVSDSTIVGGTRGYVISSVGGAIYSAGNNVIDDNSLGNIGTLSPLPLQ